MDERTRPPLRSDRIERIAAGFLRTLVDHGTNCQPAELARTGAIALDLATACLARHRGAAEDPPPETRAQAMLRRIDAFIEHNLADPDLTPRRIADRHNISLRTLYTLFRDRPAGVAGTIRRRRLERCHADLARPGLRHRPVQAIAARWGFANHTTFTRAFREAYGTTPTAHRARALAGPPESHDRTTGGPEAPARTPGHEGSR
ncbi:helix-turn-helix domain-containing protein [Kitasatospora sp. A2-31]|uniref:helix-turn-helix domain-containing protein n=1 Tax=Kitasatospora sp. A2-31 TaxID=2916414 RepID=UPI001EEDBD22|nr:helix-turn-helix domain-containing protein [Kitasatospora sp. A2-31]MCG6500065.1 helix-turn-helix domain-containing protein [Kitasatospora sp. A2-31]MCG6500229.1 helix-turn-helix domain-containing protein [Kitasatospora sp. A2-31]